MCMYALDCVFWFSLAVDIGIINATENMVQQVATNSFDPTTGIRLYSVRMRGYVQQW